MKTHYFALCCLSILLYTPIYSQIVNEGTLKISSSTIVYFQSEYTNKVSGAHTNGGNLYLKKDFINNGVTTSNFGTTFFNNSNLETQNILGTAEETTFYNLTINNTSGVFQNLDIIVDHNLLVNLENSFTVAPSKELTVTGNISNLAGNAGLVLKSDNNGTASLNHNTSNVAATVERYISGAAEDWHFLSSPISNQTIAGSSWVPSGTYGNGTGYDLYVWDEPTPCWVYQLNTSTSTIGNPNWPAVHASNNFVTARGYLYAVQAVNPTHKFTGTLHNGIINYPLTANSTADLLLTGFNLIGNPYTSAIDWKATSGWSRSNLLDSDGGYDMWIWNPTANNYGVFNSTGTIGTNGVTQFIPSMQGFYVRAELNGNIAMNNDIRLHSKTVNWMKTNTIKKKTSSIKVHLESDLDFGFDEVLFQFGYSSNHAGAAKLFSRTKTAPSIYTTYENEKLSVKYLTNTVKNPFVLINFVPGYNGRYKFTLDIEGSNFKNLILEDKIEKTFHNFLDKPTYSFNSSVKDNIDRFVLHFKTKKAILGGANDAIPIYYDGEFIVIDLRLISNSTDVQIFDLLGRRTLHKTLKGEYLHRLSIDSQNKMYVVMVKNEHKIKSQKVLMH
ncbi:hypothetical protein [Polaribacter glomeratus]|uniref:Secretion system C-terminal sorting domain-containing protein n=1 Tax=Polaribacter glomeratus TaxID=102 RepID=A0A2S7WF91_9FLAO|nr:hypothetical protein [Polaribacter glomeratus]PQJ76275.1 hypothetical protein BTO16_10150 [Polaribacter glomeratus]TXD63809.1 hypothetical protein ESX12_16945 [Polaribacter glomeratus]